MSDGEHIRIRAGIGRRRQNCVGFSGRSAARNSVAGTAGKRFGYCKAIISGVQNRRKDFLNKVAHRLPDNCGTVRLPPRRDCGAFYCAGENLAVEVDGPVHDHAPVVAYDRERETLLREAFGIRFLRLSNAFVLSATEAEIEAEINAVLSPSP